MADDGDEVKVFRSHEDDETEAPSLADDKKDVAMEEESDCKNSIFGVRSAFMPAMASPSFLPFMAPYSPSFAAAAASYPFMMNPMANAMALQIQQRMSPAYQLMNMSMAAMAPMSPSFAATMEFQRLLQAAASPGGFPGIHNPLRNANPLNQMNQRFGGINIGNHQIPSTASSANTTPKRKREKEEHIKKPMNAFMWFMKENRPTLMEEEEFKEKQSAELNKELGKRWQTLPKDKQQKYYDMANKDKEDHLRKYPNWSARENYAIHKKTKKKRDRNIDSSETKKCRARFGVNAQDKWCAPCKRKKKCAFVMTAEEEARERESTHSTHSMQSSTQQRASDSESDLEDDEPMVTEQDLKDHALAV